MSGTKTTELLSRLKKGVKRTGAGWTAKCPAHDDRTASLSISEGTDGRTLVHCHAGCTPDAIAAALGLTLADLFQAKPSSNGRRPAGEARVTRYQIKNAAGELVAVHVRKDLPDGTKDSMPWERPDGTPGLGGRPLADLPLYGIERVQELADGAHLIVTEGEKAADALAIAGYIAVVGTVTGASATPSRDVLATIARFDPYLWPDNDPPGAGHMDRIAAVLSELGVTAKMIDWTGATEKGDDAADFLARGGDFAGVVALVDQALPWEPPAEPPTATTPATTVVAYARTDAGNGELFAELHADHVRYDHGRGRWLRRAEHWWAEDNVEQTRTMARDAARERYIRAAEIAEHDEREKEARWAITSESRQKVEAALYFAQAEPAIADAGDGWDTDRYAFGVLNGIIDLRTGELRHGRPEDRITMHAEIAFGPGAECPRWLRFLDEVFAADAELIDFLQRAIGYSLTGDTSEQCIFIGIGSGANGKSVFLSTLRALAGQYGYNAPFATFELHNRPSIPNDLAALAGRRLVTASETNEGTRLNEARLKALTGGDPISARYLHREFFTFDPQAKFWLAVNHRPRVTDDSYAFWRRVRLIPFTRQFRDDADPHLADALRAELAGILAWAVQGTIEWRARGLQPPAAVRAATDDYRAESDPLSAFIEDCCVTGEAVTARAAKLWDAYAGWAKRQGLGERETLGSGSFGRRVAERFTKRRTSQGNVYIGIRLRDETEHQPYMPYMDGAASAGLVHGSEPNDTKDNVFPIEGGSREDNREMYGQPYTPTSPADEHRENPAQPYTDDGRCRECGADVWRYTGAGVPACERHWSAAEHAELVAATSTEAR